MSGMSGEREPGDPIGYSDPWSAAPGETIRFMVSTSSVSYGASLVRLFGNGSALERPVGSSIDGQYRGRRQVARAGSCVVVERAEALHKLQSLSVGVWVWPTRPRAGADQVLLTGGTWALLIDAGGMTRLRVESVRGRSELQSTRPLAARAWTFVCGSYDAMNGRLQLHCHEIGLYAPKAEAITHNAAPGALRQGGSTLHIAAHGPAPTGAATWGMGHFDGKLEAPTIYDRALGDDELARLVKGDCDASFPVDGVVAAWRFQHGVDGDRITDVGPFALHGIVINTPTRAMTGHRWRARTQDPRVNPQDYGAIHFHSDDLEDASWECDFALRVPDDLPSGVYAVKLTSPEGGKDLVPFAVRPARDRPTSSIGFLLPP